ncbi:hypothetical protein SCHPADRAFT_905976 [Schizopora paradoxa]|uniref:RlpA-like protein double-psi beta-barrel domain-containing protein n=1 Tax=Schizopora paradoxa TaxID=27342 RepID=A0A0H2RI25_9AGAM|nr:hypothetical protein SCHPADRAFT_905976 [Schizopora paradoxa]
MKLFSKFESFVVIILASPLNVSSIGVRASDADIALLRRTSEISPLSTASVFHPGLGACGEIDTDNDAVIAISTDLFDGGAHCLQWVKITDEANGVTAFGKAVDICPSCDLHSIELSPILFAMFEDLSEGVIQVEWNFEPLGFQPPK